MDGSILYLIVMIIVGGIFPVYSVLQGSKAKIYLLDNPDKLTEVYRGVIYYQVILVVLVALSLYFNAESVDVIGLAFLKNPIYSLYLLAFCLLFFWIVHSITPSSKSLETLRKKYAKIYYLIPKTPNEYRSAIFLSFVAGTAEEVIYRGFLFWQLTLFMPFYLSILVTNIIFGLLHWGTGLENVITTFVLGMIYSALSIYFDSLWAAILAHIITDLYSVGLGYKLKAEKNEI